MSGSGSKSGKLSEKSLIAAIRARARHSSSALQKGIGDDCAIVRPAKGKEIVVTTDFSLEGVHFRREWHAPEAVGYRCLVRGLSDIAAMGARPVAAFLSLAVPDELLVARQGKSWIQRFFDGFMSLAARYDVPLAGGDTARVPRTACFDIVLLGEVKRGRSLLRSRAKAGDSIYVTGALGGAAAELLALQRSPELFAGQRKPAAGHPHFFPDPRLTVGARLATARRVHAAIDISDGLSTDLAHICDESRVAAELDAAAIPIHRLAENAVRAELAPSAMELALHGGEDYELLFTAPGAVKIPHTIAGVEVHRIGRILKRRERGGRMMVRDLDGQLKPLEEGGWEHFRRVGDHP